MLSFSVCVYRCVWVCVYRCVWVCVYVCNLSLCSSVVGPALTFRIRQNAQNLSAADVAEKAGETHTHTLTCIHTLTHTHSQTCIHTNSHTFTHKRATVATHTHLSAHTHTHTCTHPCTLWHTHTQRLGVCQSLKCVCVSSPLLSL